MLARYNPRPYRPQKSQSQRDLKKLARTSCAFSSWAVFQGIFAKENGPCRHSGKRPIKVGKQPIEEGKRPIKLMGCFRAPSRPQWRAAPQERRMKRSMNITAFQLFMSQVLLQVLQENCRKNRFVLFRGPKNPPQIPKYHEPFSKSSRELLPPSL